MEPRDVLPVGLGRGGGLSAEDVAARLRRHGEGGGSGVRRSPGRGDHDLNPDMLAERGELVDAAVLVPLVERPAGLNVLLTRRTDHLTDHAGQISFPGGRVEAGDAGPAAAALREAAEEVGLAAREVRLIGALETYVTRTGFRVSPHVGLVRAPLALAPDDFEVAEVFEVPLGFFLAPGACRLDSRLYRGRRRHFYAFPYGDYYIWGATAGILLNLVEILGEPC